MPGGAGHQSDLRARSRVSTLKATASVLAIAIAAIAQVPQTAVARAQTSVRPAARTSARRTASAATAGPGYITLLFGRTMYSIADNNCNELAGSVPLDQVAQDLSNRGLTATGVVVVDRTQNANRLCFGGSLYPTWSDLDTLRDTYGWSFDSDGMSHNDITAMTPTQQYEESCGSLAYLAEEGMTTADAFYAYGDNDRSTAIQTATVSQCYDYGRTYNGGVNVRASLNAPYFQRTNSLLGGACSDTALSCYKLNVNGKRYASPVAISSLLQVSADQWVVLQFYRMVSGVSLNTTPSWDCTSPNWQDHWTSQTEMYCINDFDQAISTIPPAAVVTSPATVAAAWGRQVSNIVGQVTAQSTGQPVAGATVQWSGGTATTDSSGYYTLSNVTPGLQNLSASAPSEPSVGDSVTVTTGGTSVQNFSLGTATLGAIAGTVTDSDSHAPLAGASVTCDCSANTATTDANGRYTFQNVAPSSAYSMQFSDDGYTAQTASVAVNAGQTTTENIALAGIPGEISGQVTNQQTDSGVPATTVSCTCAAGSTSTDGSGNYVFDGVSPGTYSLTFAATGFGTDTVHDVVVAPGGETQEDASLAPGGSITGTVVDDTAGDVPLPGAAVTCTCQLGGDTTDSNGDYEFDDVAAGTYSLTFKAAGDVTQSIGNVVVMSGDVTPQDAALVEDGSIEGTVTNAATNAPIPDASVRCTCASGSTVTDSAGGYTFQDIDPGTFAVTVTAAGFASGSNPGVAVDPGTATEQDFALTVSAPSVIFSDGFESGGLSAWTTTRGFGVETTIVHSGGFAAEANAKSGATFAREVLPSTYTTGYARVWFEIVSQTSTVNVLRLNNATGVQIAYLDISPAKLLSMTAGKTLTSTTTVTSGVMHELELSVTLAGKSSTTHVWLDGTLIAALSRTVTLPAAPIGQLQLGQVMSGGTYDVVFDDAAFDTAMLP
jgi:hypothetical protein